MNTGYMLTRIRELDRRYLEWERLVKHFAETGEIADFNAQRQAWRHYCELRDMMVSMPSLPGMLGASVN